MQKRGPARFPEGQAARVLGVILRKTSDEGQRSFAVRKLQARFLRAALAARENLELLKTVLRCFLTVVSPERCKIAFPQYACNRKSNKPD